jgi:hypothetical protein
MRLLLAMLLLLLVGCQAGPASGASARTAAVNPATAPEPNMTALQLDGRNLRLWLEPTAARAGEIDRERAVRLAAEGLGRAAEGVPADEARLVVVTARTLDDDVSQIEGRRAWLVTFKGAPFPVDACACDGTPLKLGSAAVVDATDGAFVAALGVSKD